MGKYFAHHRIWESLASEASNIWRFAIPGDLQVLLGFGNRNHKQIKGYVHIRHDPSLAKLPICATAGGRDGERMFRVSQSSRLSSRCPAASFHCGPSLICYHNIHVSMEGRELDPRRRPGSSALPDTPCTLRTAFPPKQILHLS